MLKRVLSAVGNPFSYAGYAILLFVVYFLYNTFLYRETGPLPPTIRLLSGWAYILLLSPFITAGLNGAILEQQRNHGESGVGEFLTNATRYYWRTAGANFFYTLFIYAALLVAEFAFNIQQSDRVLDYIDIPFATIALFWFASVVVEGGIFASLGRGLKLLLTNPLALTLGLLWAGIHIADTALLGGSSRQASLAMDAAEAALVSVVKVLAVVYAVALYRQARGQTQEVQQPALVQPAFMQGMTPPDVVQTPLMPQPGLFQGATIVSSEPIQATMPQPNVIQAATNQGLVNASLGFGLVSFIPLAHLVALVLGVLAIVRNKRFFTRAAIAICLGAFFTAGYALLLAGSLLGKSKLSMGPGLNFLAQENPAIFQQVGLLEQDAYKEVQAQLEPASAASAKPDWTVHSALALAKWGNDDLDGALASFYAAAQLKPDRSEFYYFYGRALLAKGQNEMAGEQFQNAAQYQPRLVLAERYASLLQSAYTPPKLVSVAFSIIILLLLFTVHEYGHAYAAWKLGDDTAQRLGRLTLSPIAHLDLFGSILLPGILLFQGSGYVFGWAKPVPVNPANFKNPRKDHMIVSFAGPAVNLLVAMACFLVLGCIALVLRVFWPETLSWHFVSPWGATALVGPSFSTQLVIGVIFIKQLMYTSLILGFFNLLPIPPLDGSWILSGILPDALRNFYNGIGRLVGSLLFVILVFTPIVGYYVDIPVIAAWNGLYFLISSVGLG